MTDAVMDTNPPGEPMVIVRIASGIKQHFGIRVTEWIMTVGLFMYAYVLYYDPTTFSASPSFIVMRMYGTEAAWSILCTVVALVRISALVVNGTFKGFRYSPHLRMAASFVASTFWGLITMGIFLAHLQGGALTGVVAYGILMSIDVWNLFRASADVGAQRKKT